eukprot:scaffold45574_cov46-Attheya_sp.AAC.3
MTDVLVKDPNFAIGRGTGNAVSIEVKEDSFVAGLSSHGEAQIAQFVRGGVRGMLVFQLAIPLLPLGILSLQPLGNGHLRFGPRRGRRRIIPTQQLGTRIRLVDIRWIRPNIRHHDQTHSHRLHPFLQPPRGNHLRIQHIFGILFMIRSSRSTGSSSRSSIRDILWRTRILVRRCKRRGPFPIQILSLATRDGLLRL